MTQWVYRLRTVWSFKTGNSTRDVKLTAIGKSKGIRLPKVLLQKYDWSDSLILEEMEQGIFLHREDQNKLSWKDTYRAMAAEREAWSDLETTTADGKEELIKTADL